VQYTLRPTKFFLEQLDSLSPKTARILEEKLSLLKQNPFRYKRIRGHGLFLFRIRISDERKERRVIYLVDPPIITILCIIDRKDDYSDLEDYLKRVLL